MDKKFFGEHINKLVVEYEDKGFNMSPARITQWYEEFKGKTPESFKKAISEVLRTARFAPTMADIFATNKLKDFKPEPKVIIYDDYDKACASKID